MSVNPYEPPLTASLAEPVEPQRIWDEIEVEYELTLDDLVAFNVNHQQRSPFLRRISVGLMLFAGFGAPLALILVMAFDPQQFAPDDLPFLGAWAVTNIAVFGYMAYRASRRNKPGLVSSWYIRLYLKHGDLSSMLGRQKLRVTKDYLEEVAPSRQARWNLPMIQQIVVVPAYAFIYVSSLQAAILPVRAFESRDHFETFITNLEGHCGKRAERFAS